MESASSAAANAFHAAGGRYAVAYTDANYYVVTSASAAPGNYPEAAFGHGTSGVRTQRAEGSGTAYYLLANSSAAQAGYQGISQAIAAAGGFDYLYADGVSDSLRISLYRMAPTPVEITTDAQYVGGMKQLISLSVLPVVINGYMNGNPVLEEQEYIGSRNIVAIFGESCFTTYTNPYGDQRWTDMANALLATTAARTPAICGGRGTLSDNRPMRIYYLASWWLTYDPTYSVSWEIFTSPLGNSPYVFAEQLIVPTSPLQNAGSSIASLRLTGGAYVRQFGTCYYNRTSWGSCAAIVNPSSTATIAMPAMAAHYHHALALDRVNLYQGGQAKLSTSLPTSLAPETGIILFQ